MPMYTWECVCGEFLEKIVPYPVRDTVNFLCKKCAKPLTRRKVEQFNAGKESFQMKAILADGKKVAGHFGKPAKRKRKV